MASVTVQIEGLREVAASLENLPDALGKKVQEELLRARGQLIADTASRLVPRDHGDLQRSISVSPRLTPKEFARFQKVDPGDVVMFVGPDDTGFYGTFVEYGTNDTPAQPFMRPAWDANKEALVQGLAADLATRIEKAVR